MADLRGPQRATSNPSPNPSPNPDTDAGRGPHQVHSVLEGFHAPGMGGLWAELGCLRRAISVAHPRLAAHLEGLGLDVAIFGPGWYVAHPSPSPEPANRSLALRRSPDAHPKPKPSPGPEQVPHALSLSLALAPTRYLTLFTRILPRAEVGAALAALAARTLAPTHLALGVLLARCDAAHSFSDPNPHPDPLTLTLTLTSREALLAADTFDAAVHALCGNICASRARRAPAGVLANAFEAAALLPLAALAAIRTAECKASASEASASECGSTRAPPAKRALRPH